MSSTPQVYRVEPQGKACRSCNCGEQWDVIGTDDVALGRSFGNREDADELADELNSAFESGRQEGYEAGVRDALQPLTSTECNALLIDSYDKQHLVHRVLFNRLSLLTAPQESKEDPAVEAVRTKLNEFQNATGSGLGDLMGGLVVDLVAAVDRARGAK